MYKTTFATELDKTAAVFRVELTAPAIEAYWEAFETADDDDFRKACRKARTECEFMPTIRQIAKHLPSKPPPTDPLLTRLLQPWERAEQWPEQAVGRADPKVKKAAQKWEPKTEMEKAIHRSWSRWVHHDHYGGWVPKGGWKQ